MGKIILGFCDNWNNLQVGCAATRRIGDLRQTRIVMMDGKTMAADGHCKGL
jgi:hypothetical protein